MSKATIRVVKVGGSLFERPGLASQFHAWLDAQPVGWDVIIAGGGEMAEAIRRADDVHGLGDERSHWLCIDALRATSRLLMAVLGAVPLVETFAELTEKLHSDRAPGPLLFDPYEFLHTVEPRLPGPPLPHDWTVTSDSIAARLATAIGAEELVLFKAGQYPNGVAVPDLVPLGYVDAYLPAAARNLPPIRFVCPYDA